MKRRELSARPRSLSWNMLLQAVVRGLAAVPVGSFDGSRAARTLGLPSGQTVLYLIPVGFAASAAG